MYGKDAIGGGFGGFGGFESSTLGGAGFMGGFFPSPQKQGGGGNSPMQAPRRDTVSSRDTQGLMAVTVKMVLEGSSEMSDSNLLKFHGNHEASMIELIGQVENVEDSDNMYLRYVIDDGTGRMVCKKLIEQDRPRDTSRVFPGRFVRVVGSFRHFGSETYVNAHKIEEVVNLDDISRHRIEVAYTMLQLSGQLGEDPASGVVSGMHASVSSARENASPMSNWPVGSNEWFLDQIRRGPRFNAASTGVARQQLYQQFASVLTAKQIDEKLQLLHDEGLVFTTIDDNHFQLTN